MLHILKKLLAFLDGPSRRHLALLFVPMLLTAAMEVLSIALILPLIQVLLDPDGESRVVQYIREYLPDMPPEQLLPTVAGVCAVVFVVKNVLLVTIVYIINSVMQHKHAAFTQRMYMVYLGRPLMFHLQRNSAEIVRNIVSSANAAFEAIRLYMLIVLELLLMVMAGTLLMIVDPVITVGATLMLGLFGVVYYYFTSPYIQRWGTLEHRIHADMIREINQSLGSIRDVKLLHCENYLGRSFGDLAFLMARIQRYLQTVPYLPRLILEVMIILGFITIILLKADAQVPVDETIATLSLFGMAALRLMPSMSRVLTSISDLKRRTADIGVLFDDLKLSEQESENDQPVGKKADLPFNKELRLEQITFRYKNSERAALHGIDLNITWGQSVGFVGPSGGGKSTLMDILLGLLSPQSGNILVDGRDARSKIKIWQQHVGFVPQHIYLIDDNIRRNIAFGITDDKIDEGRIEEVLELSRMKGFVSDLPEGLETMLGERGTRLSGGQRQRVAIARALYRNPDVLIFDEATSALDNETEREISAAIDALSGNKTVLIVAHRLSTIKHCDQIVFLKEGRIVTVGSYEQLMEESEEFRNFVASGDGHGSQRAQELAT